MPPPRKLLLPNELPPPPRRPRPTPLFRRAVPAAHRRALARVALREHLLGGRHHSAPASMTSLAPAHRTTRSCRFGRMGDVVRADVVRAAWATAAEVGGVVDRAASCLRSCPSSWARPTCCSSASSTTARFRYCARSFGRRRRRPSHTTRSGSSTRRLATRRRPSTSTSSPPSTSPRTRRSGSAWPR